MQSTEIQCSLIGFTCFCPKRDGFKIPTSMGPYNPDSAVVFEEDKRVYFVAETKDTGTPVVDLDKLKPSEKQKIRCGEAHFKQFEDLEYRVITKVCELIKES